MPNKVLVIGAQGVVGAFTSRLFSAAGWDVTRAGRRPEQAPDFRLLDLADSAALSAACAEADLIVNTAHHVELAPERTVLRQGGVLLDLAELSQSDRDRLHDSPEQPRGLVVTDVGLGGVAYLTLADLLKAHPQADEAEYSLMFSAAGSTGRAGALFSHSLLVSETHHRSVRVPFPPPFGVRRCLQVGPNDKLLVRSAVGGVPVRHYLCMQPAPLNGLLLALNGARLISRLPSASFTAGVGKTPPKPSEEPVCEWVSVGRGGQRLAIRTIEGCGYYGMTAAAMVAFADALQEPAAHDGMHGLLSIDEVLRLDAVGPALEQRSIRIRAHTVGN